MFILTAELRENVSTLKRKRMTKHVKTVLDAALDFWHENFLPLHTKRTAYFRYPDAFEHRKSRGAPLRNFGHFADHIEDPSQRHRKGGTATSRKLKITLGRPMKYTGHLLEIQILKEISGYKFKTGKRLTKDEALARVYAKAGYSPKAKQTMQASLPVINNVEQSTIIKKVIKPGLIKLMNQPKPKRRKKIG